MENEKEKKNQLKITLTNNNDSEFNYWFDYKSWKKEQSFFKWLESGKPGTWQEWHDKFEREWEN